MWIFAGVLTLFYGPLVLMHTEPQAVISILYGLLIGVLPGLYGWLVYIFVQGAIAVVLGLLALRYIQVRFWVIGKLPDPEDATGGRDA